MAQKTPQNKMNREEILEKFIGNNLRFDFTPFAKQTIYKAMDEYAKSVAIEFLRWCAKHRDEHSMKTSEQLYSLFQDEKQSKRL